MRDYRDEDERLAYEKVDEYAEIIEDELLGRGYMFYDEFKVSLGVARAMPNILDEKYSRNKDAMFHTYEELIEGEGYEGIIYNNKVVDGTSEASKILRRYYRNLRS